MAFPTLEWIAWGCALVPRSPLPPLRARAEHTALPLNCRLTVVPAHVVEASAMAFLGALATGLGAGTPQTPLAPGWRVLHPRAVLHIACPGLFPVLGTSPLPTRTAPLTQLEADPTRDRALAPLTPLPCLRGPGAVLAGLLEAGPSLCGLPIACPADPIGGRSTGTLTPTLTLSTSTAYTAARPGLPLGPLRQGACLGQALLFLLQLAAETVTVGQAGTLPLPPAPSGALAFAR